MTAAKAPPSSTWALQLVLFCFVFTLLGVVARANPYAGDASLMCQVADSIVDHGGIDIRPRGNRRYAKYPLLDVLQCVPAVALRHVVGAHWPHEPGLAGFALGVPPHAVTGLLAVGLFQLALAFEASPQIALAFALLVTFTTPILPAGRSLYSETLQALLLVWAVLATLRARDARARGAFFAAGLLAGLAINAKILLAVLPLAMLADQLHERWDRARWRSAAVFCLGALPGALAWLGYNYARYGSLLAQGYGVERDGSISFGVPLASGLYGLLFSSGKSVFLYSPLLLASLWGFPRMLRERRRELWLLGIPTLVTLLAVSKWWAWNGDWAWGPRLLLPVVPLACVPALWPLRHGGAARALVLALGVAGLYVQLLAVLIAPSQLIIASTAASSTVIGHPRDRSAVRDELLALHFIPELNPIVGQQWLLERYLHKRPWTQRSYYPWRNLGIPAWRPRHDPTPKTLDLWLSQGGPLATGLALALSALALGLGALLLVLARRPRPGPAAASPKAHR